MKVKSCDPISNNLSDLLKDSLFALVFKKDGTVETLSSGNQVNLVNPGGRDHLKELGPIQIENIDPAYFVWFKIGEKSELNCCIDWGGGHIRGGPGVHARMNPQREKQNK